MPTQRRVLRRIDVRKQFPERQKVARQVNQNSQYYTHAGQNHDPIFTVVTGTTPNHLIQI
jgi:hypothetical protein